MPHNPLIQPCVKQPESPTSEELIAKLIFPGTSIEDCLSMISPPGFLESLNIEMVKSEGVYPLLCHRLNQIYQLSTKVQDNSPLKSNPHFNNAKTTSYQFIAQELDMTSGLENTLHSLDEFSPLLLKGIVTSHGYYEHPHLRPMDDIDLVIPDGSVEAVQNRLI